MTPKEKRTKAIDYARGVNCSKVVEGNEIEIADHWLTGFNEGYRAARDEGFRHSSPPGVSWSGSQGKAPRLRVVQKEAGRHETTG